MRQPNTRKDAIFLRYKEIFAEWDAEKNGPMDAALVTGQFKKRFWWICPKGHSYQSNLNQRLYASQGCPVCARLAAAAKKKRTWQEKRERKYAAIVEERKRSIRSADIQFPAGRIDGEKVRQT